MNETDATLGGNDPDQTDDTPIAQDFHIEEGVCLRSLDSQVIKLDLLRSELPDDLRKKYQDDLEPVIDLLRAMLDQHVAESAPPPVKTHWGPAEWDPADDAVANKQGWGIWSTCSGSQIQRVDDPEEVGSERHFDSDAEAAAWVQQQADVGDSLARRAIASLIQEGSEDVAKFGLHLPEMSLAEFRATRRETLDLGSVLANPDLKGVKGYVYLGVLCIAKDKDGAFCLTLPGGSRHSRDVGSLEWDLYHWASNRYFKRSGPSSDNVYP